MKSPIFAHLPITTCFYQETALCWAIYLKAYNATKTGLSDSKKTDRNQNLSHLKINEDTFLFNTFYSKLSLLSETSLEGNYCGLFFFDWFNYPNLFLRVFFEMLLLLAFKSTWLCLEFGKNYFIQSHLSIVKSKIKNLKSKKARQFDNILSLKSEYVFG